MAKQPVVTKLIAGKLHKQRKCQHCGGLCWISMKHPNWLSFVCSTCQEARPYGDLQRDTGGGRPVRHKEIPLEE